jgi:sulfhydrogenase subunit alpha
MTRTITVDHLARVEGHGGVTVELDGDNVRRVTFDIFEGIRLFEALVRGRDHQEVPGIVSRICAICSHGHAITSIHALEDALGIEVSPQTRTLRDLAYQGQFIESHALHFFCLALPDFMGQPSVVGVASVAPDAVAMALRLKKLGNRLQEVLGGRAVHPVNYVVGGFGRLPSLSELEELRDALGRGLDDCRAVLPVLQGVKIPAFVNEHVRCAAVVPQDRAFFFGDTVRLSDGPTIPAHDYRKLTNEYLVPHSHAKHSAHDGRSYMVGALARLTLHGDRIGGLARTVWEALGLTLPSSNIVMNDVAQVVELVYCVEHAKELVDELLSLGVAAESPVHYEPHACRGAAATEVPRGVLFHAYELDSAGRVVAADVITPTAQNFNNAEDQLRATVRDSRGEPDAVLRQRLEVVVRAYDPCISCSVHVIRRA